MSLQFYSTSGLEAEYFAVCRLLALDCTTLQRILTKIIEVILEAKPKYRHHRMTSKKPVLGRT
jgi:hypothetical protein